MAREPDQTRWRGIRPTDPPENIPVTESAPLTSIEVEPLPGCDNFPVAEQFPLTEIDVNPAAGCDDFPTTTRKIAPAVSDLQAITEALSEMVDGTLVCTVVGSLSSSVVPAGEIWIIKSVAACNFTTHCDIVIQAEIGVDPTYLTYKPGMPATTWHTEQVDIILEEGQNILYSFTFGGASDLCVATLTGYIISVYP